LRGQAVSPRSAGKTQWIDSIYLGGQRHHAQPVQRRPVVIQ
jgi:hypothetical protein